MKKRCCVSALLLALLAVLPATVAEPAPTPSPAPQILEKLADVVGVFWQGKDLEAQKRTMADCRNVGTALMAWVTDQLSAAAAAGTVFHMDDYPLSSYEEMKARLVPMYITELPRTDGWGHPYEYRVAWNKPLAEHVFLVRSPGKDGEFSGSEYEGGSFDPEEVDQDIVWADGFFVRWPQAK